MFTFSDNTVKSGFYFGLVAICVGVVAFFIKDYDLSSGFIVGGIIMWFVIRMYSKAKPDMKYRRTD